MRNRELRCRANGGRVALRERYLVAFAIRKINSTAEEEESFSRVDGRERRADQSQISLRLLDPASDSRSSVVIRRNWTVRTVPINFSYRLSVRQFVNLAVFDRNAVHYACHTRSRRFIYLPGLKNTVCALVVF